MNYQFSTVKDLLKYIDRENSLTNEYKCNVILPSFDLPGSIEILKNEDWDDEDIITYIVASNPVLWAQCWLKNPKNPKKPLRLYDYQKNMLNCQHRFKVSRCGRQIGKTVVMAIDVLWNAVNNEYMNILYVAPYQSQVKVFYDKTLLKLIMDVPEIHNSIVRAPTHPYHTIEWSNGTNVSAMTAGSKSGNKGSTVRGQSNISRLYLDEVEYMGSDAINSIIPTIFASDDGKVWASSTPTGKREDFYHWCMDPHSEWRCPECEALGVDGSPFHYASHISPVYTADLDSFNKKSMTHSMYEHEVLAEWGEEVQGVFRHSDIDVCLQLGRTPTTLDGETVYVSYMMNELAINKDNVYIMGVDWNKEDTGVQLVIVEYNPNNFAVNEVPPKFYRLFSRETITAKEFTERGAVARIIALCREIPVSFVYADEGHGSIQIQAIRKILEKTKNKDMVDKIVPINMSSMQDVVDPVTKERLRKPMKPFMVDSVARVVQERRMILPDSEDERTLTVGQMREYSIIRRGVSGQPIYSPDNEDILTAFMLAVLGFIREFSELVKVDTTHNIKVIDNPLIAKPDPKASIADKALFEEMASNLGMDYTFHGVAKTDTVPMRTDGNTIPSRTSIFSSGGRPRRATF